MWYEYIPGSIGDAFILKTVSDRGCIVPTHSQVDGVRLSVVQRQGGAASPTPAAPGLHLPSTLPRAPCWPVVLTGGDEAGHVAQDAASTLDDGQRVALALVGQCADQEAQGAVHLADGGLVLRAVRWEVPQGAEHALQGGLLGTGQEQEGVSGGSPAPPTPAPSPSRRRHKVPKCLFE